MTDTNSLVPLYSPRLQWNRNDINAVTLARLGYSCKLVAQVTGLNPNRVNYRAKKLGLSRVRQAYRDGRSDIAQLVIRKTLAYTNKEIAKRLRNMRVQNFQLDSNYAIPQLLALVQTNS